MDDLYRDYILEHYRRPHNFGVIDDPTASFEGSNPLCGDRITLQLGIRDGVVERPEVAHVGHNEDSATEAGIAHEVVRYGLDHLDRAVTDSANKGFVKLLVAPGKDRILGATIVGHNGGELIAPIALAMKHDIGLKKLLGTVHAYPTMAEANKMAAGEWRKANQPERLLSLVESYHRWRRR